MVKGDIAPTVLIPGDPGRVEVFASLMDDAKKVAEKREYITYTGTKDGVPVSCTSTGLGTPPTAIGVEELIRIGAKNIIRIGTCGAIQDFLEPGHMIIATGAVRGESGESVGGRL
jgi:uridine phosphorylase